MRTSTRYPTATTLAGQYRQIFEGRADRTRSGLTRKDLTVSKSTGKIVSKKKARAAKKRQAFLNMWRDALAAAACELNVPYTIPQKGTELYCIARRIYDTMLEEDTDTGCTSDEETDTRTDEDCSSDEETDTCTYVD